MLNYGITQNAQIAFYEEESELSPTDLSMYKSFGDDANKLGNEDEALSWYSRGLEMAKKLNRQEEVISFSNLILFMI